MNKLIVAISLFLFISRCRGQDQLFRPYIDWQKTLEDASQANKQILLYFGASWCAPCKELRNVVLADSSVKAILTAKFQCYTFDVDSDNCTMFLKKYAVSSYPVILIMNNQGFLKADMESIPLEVQGFKKDIIEVAESDVIVKGFSNEMSLNYPKFYDDFYSSRRKQFPDSLTVTEYLKSQSDLFSEVNWNVLNLFNTNEEYFEFIITHRERYRELYGNLDVALKLAHIYNLFFIKYTALRDSVGYDRIIWELLPKEGDPHYRSGLKSYYLKEISFLAYTGMDWNKFISKTKFFVQQFGGVDENFIYNYLRNSPNKNDSLYKVLPYILHSQANP
jgi:hypothetical protein